jgi:hypothetical protein
MYAVFELALLSLELSHFLLFPSQIFLAQWGRLLLLLLFLVPFNHVVSIAIQST